MLAPDLAYDGISAKYQYRVSQKQMQHIHNLGLNGEGFITVTNGVGFGVDPKFAQLVVLLLSLLDWLVDERLVFVRGTVF